MTDVASPTTVGLLLKMGRTRKRLRQSDAAMTLGVAQSTLSAWESDTTVPRATDLVRAAKFYDIPFGHFVAVLDIEAN